MNCRKCGTEIQDWYKFCPMCAKPVPGTVISEYGGKEYQKDDILKIAQYQTWILCTVPFLLVLGAMNLSILFSFFTLPGFFVEVVQWLHLASLIFYIVIFCLLRAAEKGNVFITVLEVILLCLPIIFILVSLLAVLPATRILKASGLKVGLLGVSKKSLDEFLMKEMEKGNDNGSTSEVQKIKKILSVSFVCLVLVILSVSAVRQFTSFCSAEADDKIEQLRKDAEQGNAVAQFELGWCYDFGEGVEKDMKQAAEWYRKAAEQGFSYAQFNLGCCYENGEGVEKDLKQAVTWYRKAAEQGIEYARFRLGYCYFNGEGVEKDLKQAVAWYRMAAEQGDVLSQFSLGLCYANGWGVEKDGKQAVYWYRKATEKYQEHVQFAPGSIMRVRWLRKASLRQ